ncbi:hypothetical protein CLV63_10733 [Murinocardiopsis flavida]|uniref:Secreted protein n=1 Tax=Murinocardiopsis flavida TaxID=645275 RepID=A0A2P8DK96_9ACTN|nr:DUF6167 family protein [Murinocardiopsis flavida]PSK97645.1 hypothetical protein CLV63_10733 [Murinocardiopsis flavida]
MIGRAFYFVAGAALGGYLVHRVNRAAQAWSPGGIAHRVEDRFAGYRAALREFNEDVGDAIEERESELRRRYPAAAVPGTPRRHALPGAAAHGSASGTVTPRRSARDAHDPPAPEKKDGR